MGCNASRVDHKNNEMFPKLPPILSRKLEEIKNRRAKSTPSKKELLNDDQDHSASNHTNDHKSNASSSEPGDDHNIESAKVAIELESEPELELEPVKSKETFSDEQKIKEEDDNKNNKEEEEEKETENLTLEDKESEHTNEEYGWISKLASLRNCPGSPSFKFYLTDDSIDHNDHAGKDDYINKGSLSDTDIDAAEVVESQTSIADSATKIKKGGRKGMRFTRVLPKGKPVRNFLNVACYYPACGGHETNRRRLLHTKSATT